MQFVLCCMTIMLAACGGSTAHSTTSATVAVVGTQKITEQQYALRKNAALLSIEQGGGVISGAAGTKMVNQVSADVMQSLIIDAVIAGEDKLIGIAVTPQQVQAQIATDAKQVGGMKALEKQLSQGKSSMAELEDETRASLNEERLVYYWAKEQAQAVATQLTQGTSFDTLASKWAQLDETQSNASSTSIPTYTVQYSPKQLAAEGTQLSTAVAHLQIGQHTTLPIQTPQGYVYAELAGRQGASVTLNEIVIAAPNPYTVQDRAAWFEGQVFSLIESACQDHVIHVYINAHVQPCSGVASPSAAASPSSSPSA